MSGGPRVLILGAGGMLGHKMLQASLAAFPDSWATLRGVVGDYPVSGIGAFHSGRIIERCEAADFAGLRAVLDRLQPQVVINCVGVIKQRSGEQDPLSNITINALLPHQLATAISGWGGRLIHISTDCVFDGRRGGYTEEDLTNAEDLYGRTKAMGETTAPNTLTLRTSIIGRELRAHRSLLDWTLSQNHRTVHGFRQAWWSGVTTNHLAALIVNLIGEHPTLSGIYQVSSGRSSKFDLLHLIRDAYGLDMHIVPDDGFVLDRSLSGSKLRNAIGYECPPLTQLIAEMAGDSTPYPGLTET